MLLDRVSDPDVLKIGRVSLLWGPAFRRNDLEHSDIWELAADLSNKVAERPAELLSAGSEHRAERTLSRTVPRHGAKHQGAGGVC